MRRHLSISRWLVTGSPLCVSLARRTLILAGTALGLCVTPGAWAAIVFNNFGPGDTFGANSYSEAGPTASVQQQSFGEGFIPTGSGYLSSITIPLVHISGDNAIHLFLSNGSSSKPGTVLESWVITGLPELGATPSPLVINSAAQPLLSAGTLYYLYSKEPGNEYDGWYWNSVSAQGSYINSRNGGPYFTGTDVQAAFRVEVTPVPEPASLSLLALLALPRVISLSVCRRREGK